MTTANNATSSERSTIEWVGSLAKLPLAEVLKRIADEEKSGDLQVILGRTIKTIYFDRGFAVFAASNLKGDRLGESMIERGRISRQEFALAGMLMKGSKRRFGQALVQAGVLSEEELGRQVALQVNKIIFSLFKSSEGIYSFDERPTIIPMNLMLSLSIYRILLEGIRFMSDGKLILAGLPPLATVVRVSENPPFTMDFNRLKPLERDVLRTVGHGQSLTAIVPKLDADRGLVLRACYGLLSAGLLESVQQDSSRRPLKVQEETGVFLLSEIERKFARIRATNVRQEILMEYDRLDRVAESELLGIDRYADPDEIRQAFEKQREHWQERKSLVEQEQSLVMKVDEIRTRIERAYQNMLAEREPAQETVSGQQPPPIHQTDSFELEMSSDDVLAREEPQPTLPPLDEELVEEVVIESGVETVAVSGTSGSEESTTTDTQPSREPVPTETFGSDETEETGQTLPARETRELPTAMRHERVKQLMRDVKLHFQVRDWEGAVALLQELVHLAPETASHHAMLARAMARHPVLRKDAERHFIEALRLSPQDADLHFSLGLYYKSFGMRTRAETELRTALRIDPSHEGARKHLVGEAGRKKDPLGTMFRKIFG